MERSNDCSEIRSHLPLYVGGELDPSVGLEVERHLERCSDCARDHADAHAARSALHSLSASTGSGPNVWPALRAQLAAEGRFADSSSEAAGAAGARRRFAWRALPLSAAAALMLLAAGVLVGRMSRDAETPGAGPVAESLQPNSGRRSGAVAQPAGAPLVRPVALRPLDPSEWPEAELPVHSSDPAGARRSDGQAAGYRLGIH